MPERKRPTEDKRWSGGDPRPIIMSAFGCEDSCFSESSITIYQTLCIISGSSINYLTQCTSSEGRPCDIFRDLAIWNECFWHVSLELRELYPGQLSLVLMAKRHYTTQAQRHEAATLLYCLLTYHRCLVSVVLNDCILDGHHQIIFDGFSKSPILRKLEVRLFKTFTRAYHSFSAGLPLLNHLQELDCQVTGLRRSFCERLSKLLVSTTSLTTFKLSASDLRARDAVVIFRGLERNRTVTTLSLGRRVSVMCQCGVEFADYLRENQQLRRLTVTSYFREDDSVPKRIIRSLFGATAVSEVSLVDFSLDKRNSRLVAEMLSENRSLRAFHMIECGLYRSGRFPESVGVSRRIFPWIIALGKNTTLERLTMDLSCFDSEECRYLFKTLALHKSLKGITVDGVPTVEICRALRDTGLLERVSFRRPHRVKDPVVTLRECKELSSISIGRENLRGFRPLHTALTILPSCSHVTSLFLLLCQSLNGDVISLTEKYIAATTVLRRLEVTIINGSSNTVDRPERALMRALSVNKSIRKLTIEYTYLDETEIQILVDKLQATRTLCELFFYPDEYTLSNLLIEKLSPRVSSNYTLLAMKMKWVSARHEDMFAVDNVVRRNLALVTRAAHFVMGMRDRYCAAATELVQWNPGLVAKVQALASVDENEAVSRIRNSLKSISELDDFMCMAGVVKCGVTCHTRDDGQLQLTDLNRDCWLHLRQHLKMDDILDAR